MLSDFIIQYLADKVHVHRWPQDSPVWNESVKKELDDSINKKLQQKHVTIKDKSVQIEDFEFTSITKIGISIPFFKDECILIFEGKFDDLFAHIHITIKHGDYLDVFNRLIMWRKQLFPNMS